MKPLHRIKGAASAAMKVLVQTSLLSGALVALVTGIASGEAMKKKGTTPYVTHFVFRPLQKRYGQVQGHLRQRAVCLQLTARPCW